MCTFVVFLAQMAELVDALVSGTSGCKLCRFESCSGHTMNEVFSPKIRQLDKNAREIFDPVRKKYIALTPEEWVRQQLIHRLVVEKKVPISLMGVELSIVINKQRVRADVVIFDRQGQPLMLCECKAEEVAITPAVFHQMSAYNLALHVPWFTATNGKSYYCCKRLCDGGFEFVSDIPSYAEMLKIAQQ